MRKVAVALFMLMVTAAASAAPLGTAFTYQGKLTDSTGNPLTGSYDLTFKLYDALTEGAQVGSTVTLTGVSVSGGLFTVKLDFGSAAFTTGAARWLETAVGGTALAPRVQITPSPAAMFSAAPWVTSGSSISYAGNVGIGTTAPDRVLTIQGNEWLSLKDATGVTKWHLYNRSGGIEFVETGVAPRLTLAAGGNVGIGCWTPGFPLTFADATGDKISLYGQSGNHYGFGIQSSRLQIYTDSSSSDVVFGYGQSASMTETMRIKGSGNVGIGTSTPAAKLDVAGTAKMTGFQLGASATAGQVLTTDATGVGTWQALPAPPTSLPPSGAAGGDLTGIYPTPTIAANAVTGAEVADNSIAAADLASDPASLANVSGGVMTSEIGGISIGAPNLLGGPFQVFGNTATVDQEQITGSVNMIGFEGSTFWQSFTAGTSGALTAVDLYLGSYPSVTPWSATLKIWGGGRYSRNSPLHPDHPGRRHLHSAHVSPGNTRQRHG